MFDTFLFIASQLIASIGAFTIVYSAAKSIYLFFQGMRNRAVDINKIRLQFGYGIILSLEFMVGADIIDSILKPTFKDIAMLAALVAIRTFLSYFLNKELEGLSEERKTAITNVAFNNPTKTV